MEPQGIRTSKTKNGVTTTYYLNGSQIMAEETNGNITVYVYDASGMPIGMQYHAASYANNVWDTFWYEKNLFGDIVAVYGNDGTKLISYTYDAWGNSTTTVHNDSSHATIAGWNPFKYRGYYYDSDLALYYINSRYYDSSTGRWVSPETNLYQSAFDMQNVLLGYNVYSYCANNPINNFDPTGQWTISVGGGFSLILFGGMSYEFSISLDDDWNLGLQVSESNVFKKKSGGTFGGISAGINGKIGFSPDADTIYDLEGEGFSGSASFKNFGLEHSTSDLESSINDVNVYSAFYGPSISPSAFDASVTASKTKTIASFNIVKGAKRLWRKVVSWFD